MKSTDHVQKQPAAALPAQYKFRNRHDAENQVCQAFTALGVLAGVDVDQGHGPGDLDKNLVQAAYESNFGDPHFLGGPCCFHYVETKDKVDALAAKAEPVMQGFVAYIRERGSPDAVQEAERHVALVEAAIAWLRKTNRSR